MVAEGGLGAAAREPDGDRSADVLAATEDDSESDEICRVLSCDAGGQGKSAALLFAVRYRLIMRDARPLGEVFSCRGMKGQYRAKQACRLR